jgi:hypothetical protein
MRLGSDYYNYSAITTHRLCFRAMQFNLLVSNNPDDLLDWQLNIFQVIGTLPGALIHRQLGFGDAHVVVQALV